MCPRTPSCPSTLLTCDQKLMRTILEFQTFERPRLKRTRCGAISPSMPCPCSSCNHACFSSSTFLIIVAVNSTPPGSTTYRTRLWKTSPAAALTTCAPARFALPSTPSERCETILCAPFAPFASCTSPCHCTSNASHRDCRGRFNFALDEGLVAALRDPETKRKLSSVRKYFQKKHILHSCSSSWRCLQFTTAPYLARPLISSPAADHQPRAHRRRDFRNVQRGKCSSRQQSFSCLM